jgi:hypothetical protein
MAELLNININYTKMKEIKKPNKKTWYICWNDENTKIRVFNSMETNQVLSTPFENLVTYTDRLKWVEILKQNGYTDEQINKTPKKTELQNENEPNY